MTVTCNYRSTAVIILPGVYLPPQRNATVADDAFSLLFISIHAPREGSDAEEGSGHRVSVAISIHAPREGSDDFIIGIATGDWSFQSTLPARGSTNRTRRRIQSLDISIHAPREGSDVRPDFDPHLHGYFNPRSPRGERREGLEEPTSPIGISIHAPREGSDMRANDSCTQKLISIHAPREGSDLFWASRLIRFSKFQSTLPARGATS